VVCAKCRNQIKGAYVEGSGGKTYCEGCAPVESKAIYGAEKKSGNAY
jgi:hypothetical protein